jgi:Protein of unknown function (DUF1360)
VPRTGKHPLGSYALLSAAYAAATAGWLLRCRQTGRPLPERMEAQDVLLMGVATHKVSRLITKEKITGFARAPFTQHRGADGPAEVDEAPRGQGLQRAVGELLVCPYCVDQWVATGFMASLVSAPRLTRWVAGVFATVAVSDFLQVAYRAAEERRDPAVSTNGERAPSARGGPRPAPQPR